MYKPKDFSHITKNKRPTFFDNKPKSNVSRIEKLLKKSIPDIELTERGNPKKPPLPKKGKNTVASIPKLPPLPKGGVPSINIGARPKTILTPSEIEANKERAILAEETYNRELHETASRHREYLKTMYLADDKGVNPSLYSQLAYWLDNASDEAIIYFYKDGLEDDLHYLFYKLIKGMSPEDKNSAFEEKIKYIQKFEMLNQ